MSAYYNENDPFAAQWLRELIKAGLIANGEVDDRDIQDVQAADLAGFVQCHFFAGIGGWSLALRLAGWPDNRAVWTGSCPCQPFSAAGKGVGADDSRDLWPTWFEFIKECRPPVVFGEQVASADGLGWIDRVSADVEAQDYALAAVDLCAPSIGAFHIRQRLWFVADTGHALRRPLAEHRTNDQHEVEVGPEGSSDAGERGAVGALDDSQRERAGRSAGREGCPQRPPQGPGEDEGHRVIQTLDSGATYKLGHANGQRHAIGVWHAGDNGSTIGQATRQAVIEASPWGDYEWIECSDGKSRPVEPGTFPLAHGIPARVGRLRGYGNAIVPQVAQAFIESYLEAVS